MLFDSKQQIPMRSRCLILILYLPKYYPEPSLDKEGTVFDVNINNLELTKKLSSVPKSIYYKSV